MIHEQRGEPPWLRKENPEDALVESVEAQKENNAANVVDECLQIKSKK